MNILLVLVGIIALGTFSSSRAIADGGHGNAHGHWKSPAQEALRRNPVRADAASLERGEKLYAAHCMVCHGSRGSGDGLESPAIGTRATDLRHAREHHTDGDLIWKIANGRGGMPAWKNTLTEEQIGDVVNSLRKRL